MTNRQDQTETQTKAGKLEFQPKQLKQTQPDKFNRQATKDSRKIIRT